MKLQRSGSLVALDQAGDVSKAVEAVEAELAAERQAITDELAREQVLYACSPASFSYSLLARRYFLLVTDCR